MATLSRATLGLAARCLARWLRTSIELFFYENDVPDDLVSGSSKLDVVLNVFKSLEQRQEHRKLLVLLEVAIPQLPEGDRKQLEAALLRDGFAVGSGRVVEADPETGQYRTAVEVLLDKYESEFSAATLRHHWREASSLFRDGKWDSSISHCRNFVEQLLLDIATRIASGRSEKPDLSRPVRVRDYLQDIGFFDNAERERLIDGIYGYFSEEGSHPGISTHSAARVANSVLASCAFYVLEKFIAWRNGELLLR